MDIALTGSVWLHALAMIIVIGYYGILGRFVLPALHRSLDWPTLGRSVLAIERRALPFILLSVILFTATGAYLVVVDERYGGLGVFDNAWTQLMLAKHVLIVVMVALAVAVDRLVARIAAMPASNARTFRVLVLSCEAFTGLGAVVILLTAAAQQS